MKSKRTLSIAAVLVALAALLTLGILRGTRSVQAQDTVPPPTNDRISFGMVGITRGQTMRLSVANISEIICPCGRVLLNFRDAEGRLVRNRDGRPIRKEVTLEPGQSTFLDLDTDDLQYPPGPTRLQIRAVITVIPPPIGEVSPPSPDRIVPTVEVITNANGRTAFAIAAVPAVQRLNPPPVGE
jgi:hypothetical protein